MTTFARPAHVAICYHRNIAGAADLASALAVQAEQAGVLCAVAILPDPADVAAGEAFLEALRPAEVLVCVGGDGTVLHASEFAAQTGTAVFGVRMGRLGFLTETVEVEAADAFAAVLRGGARRERHAMVQATVGDAPPMHALNDVVIGRAHLGRTISVGARIDGVLIAEYRADAVVVSTATGSTGYALSVGGPVMDPASTDIILVAVAPHLTRANPLLLPSDVRLRLFVERGYEAVMTFDGLHQRAIESGTVVEVTRSSRFVDFVRLGGPEQFYSHVARRLGWLRTDHAVGEGVPGAADAGGAASA